MFVFHLLCTALLPELLYNEVIYFLIELNHVVPLVLVVDVPEGDLRVLRAYLDLNCVFVRQKLKLFQRPLEMLYLTEYQS